MKDSSAVAVGLLFGASFGLAIGAGLARRAEAEHIGSRIDDAEKHVAEARLACHDDYVRAQALADQCERVAAHECARSTP